ncbi:hypothetical protein MW887_007381 [Aspergillus wentii]|nr:hypothetical protein MW887_007381 [Aspergillus wentii]
MPSLIHLHPLPFSSLPSHPSLNALSTRPSHLDFIHSILSEAHFFLTTSIPDHFHQDPKPRPSHPSTSPVYLSTASLLPGARGQGKEFWVCRRSTHSDEAVDGTASFAEFQDGLRVDHSEKEKEYTPSVTSVETLLEWSSLESIEGGWKGVDMHVNIITHTFHPTFLISPRTFINLIISAELPTTAAPGFVTVQIPLICNPVDHVPKPLRDKITQSVPGNSIFATYASVERLLSLDKPSKQVEWIMATTSDAGGSIPQWIQRSWTMGGVPKAVVADVARVDVTKQVQMF